jgi:hypothetical protein
MSERRPVCAHCIYWRPDQLVGQPTAGHCHRNPPGICVNPNSGTVIQKFPMTERAQWCGEWCGDDTQLLETMHRAMLKRAAEAGH